MRLLFISVFVFVMDVYTVYTVVSSGFYAFQAFSLIVFQAFSLIRHNVFFSIHIYIVSSLSLYLYNSLPPTLSFLIISLFLFLYLCHINSLSYLSEKPPSEQKMPNPEDNSLLNAGSHFIFSLGAERCLFCLQMVANKKKKCSQVRR